MDEMSDCEHSELVYAFCLACELAKREKLVIQVESQRDSLTQDCQRLQQEINCLRMEPCQLPKCVELQRELDKVITTLGTERDTFGKIETELAMENGKLQREVERLKADYAGMLELATAKIKGPLNSIETINKLQVERDRWRTLVEELEKALTLVLPMAKGA
jgi:hypothetical protein